MREKYPSNEKSLPVAAEARISIETPENVEFQFDLAGGGSRFLAVLIDTVIQVSVAVPLVFALFFSSSLPALEGFAFILIGVLVFLWNGYFVFFEILWHGQSPGKRIFGMRVVKDEGIPISALDSVVRNAVRVVDFLPMGYLVGALSVFLTSKHKRLGDFAAGTLVVKERMAISAEEMEIRTAAMEREPTLKIENLDRLEGDEIHFLRKFVGRSVRLDPEVREEIESNFAERLRSKVELIEGDPESDAHFIEDVYLTLIRQGDR